MVKVTRRRVNRKRATRRAIRGGNPFPHFTRAEIKAEIAARHAEAVLEATAHQRSKDKNNSNAHIKHLLMPNPKGHKHNYGSLKKLLENGNNAF